MRFAIVEFKEKIEDDKKDFDCILAEELVDNKHEAEIYVPEGYRVMWESDINIHSIPGSMLYSDKVTGLHKIFFNMKFKWRSQKWYKYMYMYACQNKFDVIIFPSADCSYLRGLRKSVLQRSKVPLIFLLSNITKDEAKKLKREIKYYKMMPNIKLLNIEGKDDNLAPIEIIVDRILKLVNNQNYVQEV